ncbi:DUF1127 domain-containing protein [Variovorax humicola]|uniref:DUF1127 domain-containing protein n=1 Tax=Variovorax humicola TaxID=1769758 RepID=A0ABU8VTU2_9BURK
MSHTSNSDSRSVVPTAVGAWFGRLSLRIAEAMAARRRRVDAYRDLQSLDEHALRDIGLSHRAVAEWPRVGCDPR